MLAAKEKLWDYEANGGRLLRWAIPSFRAGDTVTFAGAVTDKRVEDGNKFVDDELRLRGYSASTRECYVRYVRNFVRHFIRPPDQLTLEHIRQYQLYLTRDRHVAWTFFHPHIHGIVPGGGLDLEETRWVAARRDFFLPVHVLAQVFRGTLLGLLEKALDQEKIRGDPDKDPRRQLTQAARKRWVVYSKPPFADAEILASLGRSAYRIALSNDRLVALQDGQVTFRCAPFFGF